MEDDDDEEEVEEESCVVPKHLQKSELCFASRQANKAKDALKKHARF